MNNEYSIVLTVLVAITMCSALFYQIGFTSGQLDAKRDCDSFGAFVYDDQKYECAKVVHITD